MDYEAELEMARRVLSETPDKWPTRSEIARVARALLSSPSVEEVRREVIEEAARVAGAVGREILSSPDIYVMQGPAAIVRSIEQAIRALPALHRGRDKQARG